MSRNNAHPAGLDRLEMALDTYGADRTRWPAPLRLEMSGLIANSREAQKMLADAAAFERLLDMAPQFDSSRLGQLSDRIAASAHRQPRLLEGGGGVSVGGSTARWPAHRRHHGIVATALAASLVLGVFAGQLNVFNSTADVVLGEDGDQFVQRQLAQTDDADGLLDEDTL
jgi:hypothetical protein